MMINGAGGIRLRMDNHWANEEAVELGSREWEGSGNEQIFEIGVLRLGQSDKQGCRREVRMLSARRGVGKKSQMLVANIRKKLSCNKESVHFVGHSSGSEGRGRKDLFLSLAM